VVFSHVIAGPAPLSLPAAPSNVTSIAKDAAATVSWLHSGAGVTSWTITPYISTTPQTPTTIAPGSTTSITKWDGNVYTQGAVTGLANSTAYTFTVKANGSSGSSAESAQSGANTPLSGLVFGDDFNGPANGPLDPEWFVYNNRCGYLAQSEVEAYKADHCALDGSGNLKLTGEHVSYTVPRYPSDPSYPGNITQPWTSGACQSNTKTWAPSTGNTMTFEVRQQICPGISGGMWPGLLWLEGQDFLAAWKTDPDQTGWNTTGKAEIDVAEWNPPTVGGTTNYGTNSYTSGTSSPSGYTNVVSAGSDLSAAMHVFQARWKPGVSVSFWGDGTQTTSETSAVPASGAAFFLLIYLQILSGSASSPQSCLVDYVRVYDQNLG
jgi:hypothetical protein